MTTTTKRNHATTQPASKRNRKQATPAPADIITADNVITIGERIAIKALKTNLSAGGKPETAEKNRDNGKPIASGNFNFLYSLYAGLCADVHNRQAGNVETFSDGYDIVQTAAAFLCECAEITQDNPNGNGKTLQDKTTDGQTDKDGNHITILRACFRAVNRYIMNERRREYKRAYIDIIDANGATTYAEIPLEWDIPTATDFKRVNEIIAGMNLTDKQAQILRYRLRGIAVDTDGATRRKGDATPAPDSVHTIARALGVSRQAVMKHMQAIQRKFTEYMSAHPATATE